MTGLKLIKEHLMKPMFDLIKEEGQYDGEEIICIDIDYESLMLRFVNTKSFAIIELREEYQNGQCDLEVTFSSQELGRDFHTLYVPSTNMFNKLDLNEIPERKNYFIYYDGDSEKSLICKDYYMTSGSSDGNVVSPSTEEQEIFCDEIFSKMCAFCAE